VTNFDIDLHYTVDLDSGQCLTLHAAGLSFQHNSGFTHVLSDGSFSWVMPTTTDYGMSYLTSFYVRECLSTNERRSARRTKDSTIRLASWGLGRKMASSAAKPGCRLSPKSTALQLGETS